MKIRVKATCEVIGEVITNHSMTIYEACELAGVNAGHDENNDYDIDELEMDYTETEDVRYQCVSGYMDAPKGEYELGGEIDGIGPVQYIEEIGADNE